MDYPFNIKDAGGSIQLVEANGGVLIYLHYPVDSTAMLNVVTSSEPLPLLFHDRHGTPRTPVDVDPLERSPMELVKMVQAYMPHGWSLVACNIGTMVPTILTSAFKGNDVIVIDDCRRRDSYVHNHLSEKMGGELVISERVASSPRNETGCGPNTVGDTVAEEYNEVEVAYI